MSTAHIRHNKNADPTLKPNWVLSIERWVETVEYNDRPELWGPTRTWVRKIMETTQVEGAITAVICFNMILMIIETDQRADGDDADAWITTVGYFLLAFYTGELCCRAYVWRSQFFFLGWRVLDFVVVTFDLFFLLMSFKGGGRSTAIGMLRMFRIMKLARAVRMLNMFPELRLILASMIASLRAMLWGMLLVLLALVIWSIVAVQVIHPVNKKVAETGFYERSGCERCPDAFATVWASCLTIWQTVVAGDSWGTLAVPIIEEGPHTAVPFCLILISISMGIWNLILAAICEKAGEVRDEERAQQAEREKAEFEAACDVFREQCRAMDIDQNGNINKEELIEGFKSHKPFASTMCKLGLNNTKVDWIMTAFDKDCSGEIDYDEFADSIMEKRGFYQSDDEWARDLQTMLCFVKVTVTEMQASIKDMLRELATGDGVSLGAKETVAPMVAHSIYSQNEGDRELRDMLRTITRKIDMFAQQLQGPLSVEVPPISGHGIETNGSVKPDDTDVKKSATWHARQKAPAPQSPSAAPQGRGFAKRLSSALFSGQADKE